METSAILSPPGPSPPDPTSAPPDPTSAPPDPTSAPTNGYVEDFTDNGESDIERDSHGPSDKEDEFPSLCKPKIRKPKSKEVPPASSFLKSASKTVEQRKTRKAKRKAVRGLNFRASVKSCTNSTPLCPTPKTATDYEFVDPEEPFISDTGITPGRVYNLIPTDYSANKRPKLDVSGTSPVGSVSNEGDVGFLEGIRRIWLDGKDPNMFDYCYFQHYFAESKNVRCLDWFDQPVYFTRLVHGQCFVKTNEEVFHENGEKFGIFSKKGSAIPCVVSLTKLTKEPTNNTPDKYMFFVDGVIPDMLPSVGNTEQSSCSTTRHRHLSARQVKSSGNRDSSVLPAGPLLNLEEQLADLDVHQHIFKVVKPKKKVRIGALDVKPVVEKSAKNTRRPEDILDHPRIIVKTSLTGVDSKQVLDRLGSENPGLQINKISICSNGYLDIQLHQRTDRKFVYLNGNKYEISPFVVKPAKCFQCQGWGHVAKHCRNKAGHPESCFDVEINTKDVLEMIDPCTATPRCINCKGNHCTHDTKCPHRLKSYTILAQKTQQKRSAETPACNTTDLKLQSSVLDVQRESTYADKARVPPNNGVTGLQLIKVLTGLFLNGGVHPKPIPNFSNHDVSRALRGACDLLKNRAGIDITSSSVESRTHKWYQEKFPVKSNRQDEVGGEGVKPCYIKTEQDIFIITKNGKLNKTINI